jgi:hypothetical protein
MLRADEKLKKHRLGMDFNMNTRIGFLGKRKLQEFGAYLNKRADDDAACVRSRRCVYEDR